MNVPFNDDNVHTAAYRNDLTQLINLQYSHLRRAVEKIYVHAKMSNHYLEINRNWTNNQRIIIIGAQTFTIKCEQII